MVPFGAAVGAPAQPGDLVGTVMVRGQEKATVLCPSLGLPVKPDKCLVRFSYSNFLDFRSYEPKRMISVITQENQAQKDGVLPHPPIWFQNLLDAKSQMGNEWRA